MAEVKKAARENSPDLMDILALISLTDVMPSCFKEALLEASRGGHVDAICSLIITAGRHTLQLKNCIIEALKFDYFEAAAMLLTCYAAKHDKQGLLKYLITEKASKDEALAELPQDELIRGSVDKTRYELLSKYGNFKGAPNHLNRDWRLLINSAVVVVGVDLILCEKRGNSCQ